MLSRSPIQRFVTNGSPSGDQEPSFTDLSTLAAIKRPVHIEQGNQRHRLTSIQRCLSPPQRPMRQTPRTLDSAAVFRRLSGVFQLVLGAFLVWALDLRAAALLVGRSPDQGSLVSPLSPVDFRFSEPMLRKQGIVWFAYPGSVNLTNWDYRWSPDQLTLTAAAVYSFPPNSLITWFLDFDDFGTLYFDAPLAEGYRGGFRTGPMEPDGILRGLRASITRHRRFSQTANSGSTISAIGSHFLGASVRVPRGSVSVFPALTPPGAGGRDLSTVGYGGDDFSHRSTGASIQEFQAFAGQGVYRIDTLIWGTNFSLSASLDSASFPPPPGFTDMPAMKSVNIDGSLAIRFDGGGSVDDFVQVLISRHGSGAFVYGSPYLDGAGALNGSSNAVVLAPGTLDACAEYDVSLARWTVIRNITGTHSLVSMTGSETTALMTTAACNNPRLTVPAFTSGQFSLIATSKNAGSYILERSPDLTTWTRVSTNSPAASATLQDAVTTNSSMFYRVLIRE